MVKGSDTTMMRKEIMLAKKVKAKSIKERMRKRECILNL